MYIPTLLGNYDTDLPKKIANFTEFFAKMTMKANVPYLYLEKITLLLVKPKAANFQRRLQSSR